MRIVGMREHIFSHLGGAVAHFAAANEFVFGTIVQRFLTWPLRARFHYGHPDVWDKTWALTSGGISKSSKTLHVSEDIFGGFNTVLRGGGIEYYEFIHCGKGRDMGFTAVNGFETKISAGNSLQCCSRDLYRLGKSFDLFRLFSMFFSGSGFYMTTMFTLWAVYMFAYGQLLHALCGAELFVHREWAPADAPPPPPAPEPARMLRMLSEAIGGTGNGSAAAALSSFVPTPFRPHLASNIDEAAPPELLELQGEYSANTYNVAILLPLGFVMISAVRGWSWSSSATSGTR
jgi:1,3-beta-glucan synthase component.